MDTKSSSRDIKLKKTISQTQADYYALIERKQDQSANRYFAKFNISKNQLYYANFKVYAGVKQLEFNTIVSSKDQKVFAKFARHWIIKQGAVSTKYLTKIKSMLKYYSKKAEDLRLRQLRLTRKTGETSLKIDYCPE